MGKKKHKQKHDGKHEDETGHAGPFPLPLAGIAAMVTHQLQSPTARAAMASGLRAAADALSRSSAPPKPPTPPQPAAAPVSPADPAAPQGTTRSPNPDAIAGAIGEAAELVLARLFGKKG